MDLNIYVHYNGNCEEAFKFYEKALGGKIDFMMKFEGSPMADQTPAGWGDKVLHARMTIGDKVLMGSDAPPGRYTKPSGFSINVGVNDATSAEKAFNDLSAGGQVQMPLAETFWAIRFGMLVDQFGVPWMVNCEKK